MICWAVRKCHSENPADLRKKVFAIQDRTIALLLRAGTATATVAKLFELTHAAERDGKKIDQRLYQQAKDSYEEAFFRSLFIGAENSVGFHNPPEAARILGMPFNKPRKQRNCCVAL